MLNKNLFFLLAIPILAIVFPLGLFSNSVDSVQNSAIPQDVPTKGDGFKLHGIVEYIVTDKQTGQVKSYEKYHNLVVSEGVNTVLDLVFPDINLNSNATDNQFSWIRIGEGTTAPAISDNGIETPIGGCDAIEDTTVTGGSAAGTGTGWAYVSVQFDGNDCAGTITESVLANDKTGGEILSRLKKPTGTTIGAGDFLTVNWNVTATDASGD